MKRETENQGQAERGNSSVNTYTVDSFADGIAFGQHKLEGDQDPREFYNLRLQDDTEMIRLRSRYTLHKEKPLFELERNLMRLSSQGILGSSVIYFGTTTDPFHPFEGKFDASMKFLELFRRYTPGMLHVQTRSPLIVLAMPIFKALGKHVSVTLGIETSDQAAAQRYTPDLPKIEDRLRTASALRNLGVEVSLQIAPLLPYGDWRAGAKDFAELLVEYGDYIYAAPITDGTERVERKIRNTVLARKLAEDRKFHWLRPDSAVPLITQIEKMAPEKLIIPKRSHLKSKQLEMFAA